MKPRCYLSIVVCCLFLAAGISGEAANQSRNKKTRTGPASARGTFAPSCPNPSYPEPAPKAALGIDHACGLSGSGGAEANQNMEKNNFCASGTPQPISFQFLRDLQSKVESDTTINFGNVNSAGRKRGPTVDRAALQTLGEDKLVTLTAYVLIARQEGAESVNCGANVPNAARDHDIHISLVPMVDTANECSGIVAEMSPHHRPDSWTAQNVMSVAKAKAPVRVTGHLFFDSSHLPCSGSQGTAGNPKRFSLWEIHPIYKFEVGDGKGNWTPLDQWHQ